jgi:hypothetical protein
MNNLEQSGEGRSGRLHRLQWRLVIVAFRGFPKG